MKRLRRITETLQRRFAEGAIECVGEAGKAETGEGAELSGLNEQYSLWVALRLVSRKRLAEPVFTQYCQRS